MVGAADGDHARDTRVAADIPVDRELVVDAGDEQRGRLVAEHRPDRVLDEAEEPRELCLVQVPLGRRPVRGADDAVASLVAPAVHVALRLVLEWERIRHAQRQVWHHDVLQPGRVASEEAHTVLAEREQEERPVRRGRDERAHDEALTHRRQQGHVDIDVLLAGEPGAVNIAQPL